MFLLTNSNPRILLFHMLWFEGRTFNRLVEKPDDKTFKQCRGKACLYCNFISHVKNVKINLYTSIKMTFKPTTITLLIDWQISQPTTEGTHIFFENMVILYNDLAKMIYKYTS